MEKELTEQEEIFYGNYGYTNECDLCGKTYPIHRYDPYREKDNDNYLEYNGKQLLCLKCK